MTHWLNEPIIKAVKLESGSPSSSNISSSRVSALMASSLTNNTPLDSTSLFCTNPSTNTSDNFQSESSFEQKQGYYNTYYNGMQQYTSSFYPPYATAGYPSRSSKISSADTYIASNYANVPTSMTNNAASQLYSTYGYNNFNQFSGTQQDYPAYYNDQYGHYNTSSYPSYANSPSLTSSQNIHVSSILNANSSDIHSSTPAPVMLSNEPIPAIKRTRGRRHANLSPTRSNPSENGQTADNVNGPDRVFIWDLDETIIIFHSLITGSFANRYSKDAMRMNYLATAMEELIFSMADHHFFFNDIESCDQVHIDDASADDNGQELTNYEFRTDGFHGNANPAAGVRGGADWMRKLAFRYRKIKEIYNTYKNK